MLLLHVEHVLEYVYVYAFDQYESVTTGDHVFAGLS
jgi:hypothetical protein